MFIPMHPDVAINANVEPSFCCIQSKHAIVALKILIVTATIVGIAAAGVFALAAIGEGAAAAGAIVYATEYITFNVPGMAIGMGSGLVIASPLISVANAHTQRMCRYTTNNGKDILRYLISTIAISILCTGMLAACGANIFLALTVLGALFYNRHNIDLLLNKINDYSNNIYDNLMS